MLRLWVSREASVNFWFKNVTFPIDDMAPLNIK